MKRIGVLIVDDSAVVRQVLTMILGQDPQIEVLGAVADPLFAAERMKLRWPDVIVLDVEMPRMDGVTFLRKIMSERPTPTVICSSLTEASASTTMEALAAGAVAIVTKPKLGVKGFLLDSAADLLNAVKAAAGANLRKLPPMRAAASAILPQEIAPKLSADAILSATAPRPLETTERVVAIGTSTGGTQALEAILTVLPKACPGIVIAQHMPEAFTLAFARRLDGLSQISVSEARHGERLLPGHAVIAPGGKHLLLQRRGAYYYVDVVDGPAVNRHKPSVDVLFRSVARAAGQNALGIIMTGMGDDGARGLREMLDAGAYTVAQDEKSCVVFGMPKEAIELGAAREIAPLARIPEIILGARLSSRTAPALGGA